MNFDEKVKNSFKAVKSDVSRLKTSVTEWVLYLNSNQKMMKAEIAALKQRIRRLEQETLIRA